MRTAKTLFALFVLTTIIYLQTYSQGNCLDFDGTNDYVSRTHSSALDINSGGTGDFTIEFWIKTSQSTGYADILAKKSGSTGYALYLDNGKVQMDLGGSDLTVINTSIADGSWHHIAIVKTTTYSGKSSTPYHYFTSYLNGSTNSSGQFGNHSSLNSTGALTIGTWTGDYFDGRLEELRFWDEAVPQSDIQDNMFQEISASYKLYYYKFNDASGSTTTTDRVTNTANATLYNFAGSGSTSNFVTSDVKWSYSTRATGLWNDAGTWTDGDIPLSSSKVEINHTVTIQGDRQAKEIIINNGGKLIIKHNGTLTVGNGGLTNSGGNFEILSDIGGNIGSLVLDGSSATGGGTYKLKRYMVDEKWHAVSSPNSASPAWDYAPAAIYRYDNSVTTAADRWVAVSSGNLGVGKGYYIYRHPTTSNFVEHVGAFNSGNKSVSLVINNSDGYNLIGNPYPSTIDWDKATIPANMEGAIYVYDDGDILTYVNGAGTARDSDGSTTRYIPATQGFFVYATGSATFTFKDDMRTTAKETYRSQEKHTNQFYIGLKGKMSYDETVIRFLDDATFDFDGKYDGRKMFSDKVTSSQIYVTAEDKRDLSINSIPHFKNTYEMPLKAQIKVEGEYSLNLNIENYEEHYNIFLEDKFTGKTIDLRISPKYVFYGKPTDEVDRFSLYLVPGESIENNTTDIVENTSLQVDIFAGKNKVYVSTDFAQGDINIFNMVGKSIYSGKLTNGLNEIPLNVPTGIYIVKVNNNGLIVANKVYLR